MQSSAKKVIKSNVLQKKSNTLELLLFLHGSIRTFRFFGHF